MVQNNRGFFNVPMLTSGSALELEETFVIDPIAKERLTNNHGTGALGKSRGNARPARMEVYHAANLRSGRRA